ncbi:hypothetical protein SDC9_212151 [bioreactor metagenome]|uniref:Uncharacterized protein n=1 Tax=bioreactor metagenome TaxID=1076179 RepID=A0A645JNN9_9ZZZZ
MQIVGFVLDVKTDYIRLFNQHAGIIAFVFDKGLIPQTRFAIKHFKYQCKPDVCFLENYLEFFSN